MFGSEILEVAVGLIFVFLLISLFMTAVREALEGLLKSRAADLERGIRILLNADQQEDLLNAFYNHPLIYSLYQGPYKPGKSGLLGRRTNGANLPSYIPASSFALAVMDLVAGESREGQTIEPARLRAAAESFQNRQIGRMVAIALDASGGDLAKAQAQLEASFDGAMNRVSGWYKRRTQNIILALSISTAILLNLNSFAIVQGLMQDSALREAIAAQAATAEQTPQSAGSAGSRFQAVYELGLPIGWTPSAMRYLERRFTCSSGLDCVVTAAVGGLETLLGWLITAFAVSLGAPFWFDALNKMMVIRSTVKPNEKTPPEGSEDRRSFAVRSEAMPPAAPIQEAKPAQPRTRKA